MMVPSLMNEEKLMLRYRSMRAFHFVRLKVPSLFL